MSEWPIREITDPRMLRALAHPIRIKLFNALVQHGPATATELAELIDDTAANCSWHLRHLAKFGYIEEAEDLPRRGRNRPWRWVPVGNRWGSPDQSPDLAMASREVTTAMLGHELAQLHAWQERGPHEDRSWYDAALLTQSLTWLTADELAELGEKIREAVMSFHERHTKPELRPDDARLVRFVAWGVPATEQSL